MSRTKYLMGLSMLMAGCGAAPEAEDLAALETESEELFGSTNQVDIHPFASAVAKLNFFNANPPPNNNVGGCTGTLIRPNKILTAAHCFCGPVVSGNVQFAGTDGQLTGPVFNFGAGSWTFPAGVRLCGGTDWIHDAPRDIAVITLQAPLPAITPAAFFMGDAEIAFNTRLNPAVAPPAQRLAWSVGYGNNSPFQSPPSRCLGCSIRRSAPFINIRPETDPCFLFGEFECWDGLLWSGRSIEEGNSAEVSNGDSGGPLLFNVDPNVANNGLEVVSGVTSHHGGDEDGASRWSTMGANADFLWQALELPFTLTLAQQQAGTAVFARRSLNINDRAHVQNGLNASVGARLVAGAGTGSGFSRAGVEAFAGDFFSRGPISVANRARLGNVRSTNRVTSSFDASTASVLSAEFQRFEDFDIVSPFPAFTTTTNVGPGGSVTMNPGVHGNTTVFGNSTLTLGAGLHVFNRLQLESNSILSLGSGPTWVFVNAGGQFIVRGQVLGVAGGILIAAPNATSVVIGNNFTGTLVAPRASVSADMVTNAVLRGAFFVNDFELHQGRFLQWIPFLRNWIPTCAGGGFFPCT